jgi:hypothetical protein
LFWFRRDCSAQKELLLTNIVLKDGGVCGVCETPKEKEKLNKKKKEEIALQIKLN